MENVTFSPRLFRQSHIRAHSRALFLLRVFAFLMTIGEVLVCYICFKRADFLGAYAMGAYLAKEKVIAKIMGRE